MSYYVSGCIELEGTVGHVEDDTAEFFTLYEKKENGQSHALLDCADRLSVEAAMAVYIERDALQEQVRALAAENVALKSGIGFFSYGTDSGYEEHATADDAIKAADSDIDYYRGDACDGWSDETDQVVWGVVIQRANMVGLRTETDDSGREKEICDYALLPPVETPATDAAIREIRAQAVDMAENHLFNKFPNIGVQIMALQWLAKSIRAGEQP